MYVHQILGYGGLARHSGVSVLLKMLMDVIFWGHLICFGNFKCFRQNLVKMELYLTDSDYSFMLLMTYPPLAQTSFCDLNLRCLVYDNLAYISHFAM